MMIIIQEMIYDYIGGGVCVYVVVSDYHTTVSCQSPQLVRMEKVWRKIGGSGYLSTLTIPSHTHTTEFHK